MENENDQFNHRNRKIIFKTIFKTIIKNIDLLQVHHDC
jgi:hypothetical protein